MFHEKRSTDLWHLTCIFKPYEAMLTAEPEPRAEICGKTDVNHPE